MSRSLLLAFAATLVAGCQCGPTRQSCNASAQCPSGQLCSAGFCVVGSTSDGGHAGGTGGGAGTGGNTGTGGSTGTGGTTGTGGGTASLPPCVGLQCQQTTCESNFSGCTLSPCSGGAKTSISGVVREPAGQLPLYNVLVYVPNSQPQAFGPRASCEQCGSTVTGSPLAITLTDDQGRFTLNDVPVGADIPLVMQIGRWRRQVKIPNVGACVNTPVTDPNLTRMPRNKTEGDLPLMAIASGGADPFECLLLKMGIASSEFTKPTGAGRVHFFMENGLDLTSTAPSATGLTNTSATLNQYDVVFLPCEGSENRKSGTQLQNVVNYVNDGGRVFVTHYGYVWTAFAPAPFPSTANWAPDPNLVNTPPDPVTVSVNTGFAKGQAFASWLKNVGATSTTNMSLIQSRNDVGTVKPGTTAWMHGDVNGGSAYNWTPHLTFTMPFNPPNLADGGAGQTCGRVVFSDFHVTTSATNGGSYFPSACVGGAYTPQEKALVFMVFDLSSCVQDDSKPPSVCKGIGGACAQASDCCSGLQCNDQTGNACAGTNCACAVPFR